MAAECSWKLAKGVSVRGKVTSVVFLLNIYFWKIMQMVVAVGSR